MVSDLLAKKVNYEPRRKSSELEGRSSSLCFGGWGDENTGGSMRGREGSLEASHACPCSVPTGPS